MDIVGNPRVFEDIFNQIDIGAYEYQGSPKIQSPFFNPTPGEYPIPQVVQILCTTEFVEIHYTLDGSTPDLSSPIYSEPLNIDSTLSLQTIAFKSNFIESDVILGNYVISDQKLQIDIQCETLWLDSDYDGFASNWVNGEGTNISYGSITSYSWIIKNDTLGSGSNTEIDLPTGTNNLVLSVRTDRGIVEKDSIKISVYSSTMSTNGVISSSVSQLDNRTFLISSEDDKIYSFDSTGTVHWTFLTGGNIRSTIAVKNESNIYVGSSDTRLYSFDYLGNPNWDKAMGGVILSSPSLGSDGTVYTGINSGRLSAVSESGTFLWSVQTGGAVISSPSVSSSGNIFFGSSDGKLYAVATSGDTLWTYITGDSIVGSPALGADSSVVIGSLDGYLYKIKDDGNLEWKFDTQSKIYSSPVIGFNGEIFIGSNSGYLYSVSKEGSENWKYYAGSAIRSTPAIGVDGSIYFGCNDGRFIALSDNGDFKWYLQTGQSIIAPPLVTDNNLIYIGSTDNKVYILKDAQPPMPKRLDFSQFEWPTFKGNNQRTGYLGKIATSIVGNFIDTPKQFKLYQNYPNPFNPSTRIKYALPKSDNVRIEIYNTLGQVVWAFSENQVTVGYQEVEFTAQNLSSGIYYYRIQAGEFQDVKKMILIR